MKRQAIEELIVAHQILPYAVDNQMQEFMLFMQEERDGEVADLFFGVLVRRDEINSLQMPEVDIPPQYVYVQQLANIFLSVVAIEVPILELLPYVGQLLIDSLFFQIPCSCIS